MCPLFIFGVAEVRTRFKYPWKSGVLTLVELKERQYSGEQKVFSVENKETVLCQTTSWKATVGIGKISGIGFDVMTFDVTLQLSTKRFFHAKELSNVFQLTKPETILHGPNGQELNGSRMAKGSEVKKFVINNRQPTGKSLHKDGKSHGRMY